MKALAASPVLEIGGTQRKMWHRSAAAAAEQRREFEAAKEQQQQSRCFDGVVWHVRHSPEKNRRRRRRLLIMSTAVVSSIWAWRSALLGTPRGLLWEALLIGGLTASRDGAGEAGRTRRCDRGRASVLAAAPRERRRADQIIVGAAPLCRNVDSYVTERPARIIIVAQCAARSDDSRSSAPTTPRRS